MNQHDKVREAILAINKAVQDERRADLDVTEAERRLAQKSAIATNACIAASRTCKAVFGEKSQCIVIDGDMWKYECVGGEPKLTQECKVIVLKEGGGQ